MALAVEVSAEAVEVSVEAVGTPETPEDTAGRLREQTEGETINDSAIYTEKTILNKLLPYYPSYPFLHSILAN